MCCSRWSTSNRKLACDAAASAAVSSGLSPAVPPPPAPPAVVPPQVLALDLGAYDIELDPDTIGDSAAGTPACVAAAVVSSAAGGDAPPALLRAGFTGVGASSAVVVVASVRGLKLAAAAAAAADTATAAGAADDDGICLIRACDCHDLRRSGPDAVVNTASASHNINTSDHPCRRGYSFQLRLSVCPSVCVSFSCSNRKKV